MLWQPRSGGCEGRKPVGPAQLRWSSGARDTPFGRRYVPPRVGLRQEGAGPRPTVSSHAAREEGRYPLQVLSESCAQNPQSWPSFLSGSSQKDLQGSGIQDNHQASPCTWPRICAAVDLTSDLRYRRTGSRGSQPSAITALLEGNRPGFEPSYEVLKNIVLTLGGRPSSLLVKGSHSVSCAPSSNDALSSGPGGGWGQ